MCERLSPGGHQQLVRRPAFTVIRGFFHAFIALYSIPLAHTEPYEGPRRDLELARVSLAELESLSHEPVGVLKEHRQEVVELEEICTEHLNALNGDRTADLALLKETRSAFEQPHLPPGHPHFGKPIGQLHLEGLPLDQQDEAVNQARQMLFEACKEHATSHTLPRAGPLVRRSHSV